MALFSNLEPFETKIIRRPAVINLRKHSLRSNRADLLSNPIGEGGLALGLTDMVIDEWLHLFGLALGRGEMIYVPKPSFLTLIASISPYKSFQRHTRLRPSSPPAYQKSHYQTRLPQFTLKSDQVSTSCSQQLRPFQRPEPQCRPRAVIFRYRSSSSIAPNKQRDNLPSEDEGQRSHLSKKFSHLMDNVQSNIFFAGQRLNDLTGYSGIEALKRDIEEQERGLQTTRTSLQQAREAYSAAISQRSTSQREVNELLQRKHAWAPSDLERFTALYRSDHANEQAESMAKEQLESIERKAEEAASRLSASILARYHEEQIWSDKIRRMSTWGTWGLMGVNVLLFLVFQILVEPWRRKRLVTGFEDKVMEALAEREAVPVGIITKIETEMSPSSSHSSPETITPAEQKLGNELTLEPTSAVLEEANYVASSTAGEELTPTDVSKSRSVIEYAKKALRDRFSNGQITMRRLDLTIIALESAAIGMATVGLAILFLSRRQ